MGKITATLKMNEPKNWIYWNSKPANRYELTYNSGTHNKPHTIYGASLTSVFRNFFLKIGTFNRTYHLQLDSSVNPDQAEKANRKFDEEIAHLNRRLLGLGSDQPLPTGKALEDALKTSFEKQKADLKQEMQHKTKWIRRGRNMWGGLGILCIIGLGIVATLAAASVIVFPPFIIISSAVLGSALFMMSTIGFGTCFMLDKSLVKDTQNIDQLDNPFSLRKKYPSDSYDTPAAHVAKTKTGQLLEPNPTPNVQVPVATPSKPGPASTSSPAKKGSF